MLNVSILEWQRRGPADVASLVGAHLDEEGRALAARLDQQKMLHVDELASGVRVESTSFVGRVSLGDLEVTIQPKLRGRSLIRLFRYACGFDDLDVIGHADFGLDGALLLDLLLAQLDAELSLLLGRPLERRYRRIEEDLVSPRGGIDFLRLTRRAHEPIVSLPCAHHVRIEDTPLNRALVAGAMWGASHAADRSLARSLDRRARSLGDRVVRLPLTHELLARAASALDRQTIRYAPVLELLAVLLEGVAPSFDRSTKNVSLPGFLFDMNRFFQRLLARLIRENMPDYRLAEEQAIPNLMRYAEAANPRSAPSPRPRPDFVVTRGAKSFVFDAKYRDLWQKPLPREMLYQLAMYALASPAPGRATILYPTTDAAAQPALIELRDDVFGWKRASVALAPVRLDELERLVMSGDAQRRSEFAERTLFAAV